MILNGRAAKLVRRAELKARGTPKELLDEMTAAVGLPGQPFHTQHGGQVSAKLAKLPEEFTIEVARGEGDACACVRAYHAHVCDGAPGTKDGRNAALKRGWAGPQQAFALAGKHPCSSRMCNLAICVRRAGELVAILAMSLSGDARGCLVQAIHAALSVRGPVRVTEHMWARAKACVAEQARAKRSASVRFALELPCCQSQQGAHFWITRMGWDGTQHARDAADAWGREKKWQPGTYELWYVLRDE